jgi:amino acid transporter
MMMNKIKDKDIKEKNLGFKELVAIAIGGMVGGGIFTILGISVLWHFMHIHFHLILLVDLSLLKMILSVSF